MRLQTTHENKTTNTSFLSILLLIILCLQSCNKEENTFEKSTLSNDISNQEYVNILEKQLANLPNNAQVAIGLVRDDTAEYIGVINEDNILKSVANENNVFEIGSITKVFTSICLSELLLSNNVSLTETLQNQFDFQLKLGKNITLQQLANHTSGLPSVPNNVHEVEGFNTEDPYAIYSFENLKSYLQNHIVLDNKSNDVYQYSNLGTGLLAYSLAKKRNTTVDDMMKNIIFNPLEMHNTSSLLNNIDTSKLVEPKDINGNTVSHWNFAETMSGGGSIKSSVADMIKFIKKNFENNTTYNLPQKDTFKISDNLSIGLGWLIYKDDNFTIHNHDGSTGGFTSMLMLDKNKKTGVIVLANVENYNKITPLCNDLFLKISNY